MMLYIVLCNVFASFVNQNFESPASSWALASKSTHSKTIQQGSNAEIKGNKFTFEFLEEAGL